MGKPLIQQRRGKGSARFRSPGFRGYGEARFTENNTTASVVDILVSPMHSAPITEVRYENGKQGYLIAQEGINVGDTLSIGKGDVKIGNFLPLADIPLGTMVCNIEGKPGDGGRFVRGSGTFARVVAKAGNNVTLLLPSKKRKAFNASCRATLGIVAGGGRLEKPIMKAGTKYYKVKARNKFWPLVSGAKMNAVAHPYGGKRSSRKGRPTIAPRNAPPGRKVGMIRPRKTGRARGTRVRKS